MNELTRDQIQKVYNDFEDEQEVLCRTKEDAFIRGVQYALRHVEGGEWKE